MKKTIFAFLFIAAALPARAAKLCKIGNAFAASSYRSYSETGEAGSSFVGWARGYNCTKSSGPITSYCEKTATYGIGGCVGSTYYTTNVNNLNGGGDFCICKTFAPASTHWFGITKMDSIENCFAFCGQYCAQYIGTLY